jgi:hypothetical protein
MATPRSVFTSYLTLNHTSLYYNIVPYLHVRFIHEFLSAAVAMDDVKPPATPPPIVTRRTGPLFEDGTGQLFEDGNDHSAANGQLHPVPPSIYIAVTCPSTPTHT